MVAENLSKSYGVNKLFEGVSFGMNEGDKCGVIGVNGTGKSTLLKILAGIEEPDTGTVTTRKGLRISYLAQAPEYDNSLSILENVIRDKEHPDGFHNLEGEARANLRKLGIPDPDVKPDTLSGGQRKRAALCGVLLMESDMLILDEPTNHLDSEMTEWLQEVLKEYKGAFICITHDRYFLDEVTNKILELDKGSLYSYEANYSKFVELKSEREEMANASERKAATLYKQELAWMLRGARARTTKQKAHIERFKALRDRRKPVTDEAVSLFSVSSRLGKKTLEASHLKKSYGDLKVIDDFSYIFLQNDRIGIIGRNGCGKSTLLSMLTGRIMPDSGTVEKGSTVKFGIFAQECSFPDPSVKAIDYIKESAEIVHTSEGPITASGMCERFLFGPDKQYAPIGKLSGGEKRRLYLLKVLMEAPNILVLDEPTNDLDITTLTILEDYLRSFEGIIIAVSHDRYFLDKLVGRIFVFRENGVIDQVEGNYTDYREKELECIDVTLKKQAQVAEAPAKKPYRKPEEKKKLSFKEQREYDTIEDEIALLEDRIAQTQKEIEESSSNYSRLTELMNTKDELEEKLIERTGRWMELTEMVENFKNGG